MRLVVMTMEIAVDYPWRKTFVLNAFVKVNQIAFNQWKKLNQSYFFFLVFTCKTDADCYGNGYCHARECKCSANYEYAQDCSHHGCKYIKQTFAFHSTPTPWLTLLLVLRKSGVNQISC